MDDPNTLDKMEDWGLPDEASQEQFFTNDDYCDYYRIVVDPKQSPIRIDKFLLDRMTKISRNRIQNAIRAGSILVDDKNIKPNYKIRPGDVINMILPKPPGEGARIQPQNIPLDIRYEDEDLLVLHKPAGLVVHPGIGHSKGTLVNALAYHFHHDLPVLEGNQSDRLGLVHRIDKNTSGLMVVAKNEYAMAHLAKQFFYHTIDRLYLALVWGQPEPVEGTISSHIGRHPRFRKRMTTFEEGEQGKWAVTHYKVLEPMYYVSLVECALETGRTHQIRVHLESLGHSLFNDEKYGGAEILKGTIFSKYKQFVHNCFEIMPRHALHARVLGFEHPRTGERMYFESELPEDFKGVLEKWRHYLQYRKQLLDEQS